MCAVTSQSIDSRKLKCRFGCRLGTAPLCWMRWQRGSSRWTAATCPSFGFERRCFSSFLSYQVCAYALALLGIIFFRFVSMSRFRTYPRHSVCLQRFCVTFMVSCETSSQRYGSICTAAELDHLKGSSGIGALLMEFRERPDEVCVCFIFDLRSSPFSTYPSTPEKGQFWG